MLDPGIGFGKTKAQNLAALAATPELGEYGLPILIGISRKSIFGALLGASVEGRLIGTIAANLVTAMYGATIFRVHDPAEHRAAFTVLDAIANAEITDRVPIGLGFGSNLGDRGVANRPKPRSDRSPRHCTNHRSLVGVAHRALGLHGAGGICQSLRARRHSAFACRTAFAA